MLKSEKVLSFLNFEDGALSKQAKDQIDELKLLLLEDIRKDNNKKAGKSNIEKSAKAIIKSAKKRCPHNNSLHGSWVLNGKQYVSDGCRLMRINNPIELEKIPSDVKPIDCEKYFDDKDKLKLVKISLPRLNELKNEMKILKARTSSRSPLCVMSLENGQNVDMQFIIGTLEAIGENEFTCLVSMEKFAPIYIESKDVSAVILPIKCASEYNEKYFIIE